MINEFLNAFGLVFLAEVGDKTQIIAMAFASQYLIKDVIRGISLGVLLNHGMAIFVGYYLSKTIPINGLQVIAGLAFVIFAYMALFDEDVDEFSSSKRRGPVLTVAISFFLGELGDKTQLTALTLATEAIYPIYILAGTTLAMLASSFLAIYVGKKLGNRIPEVSVKLGSSFVFILFGLSKLFKALAAVQFNPVTITSILAVGLLLEIYLIYKFVKRHMDHSYQSGIKRRAEELYIETENLKKALDCICLTEDKCGSCAGDNCLLGFIRHSLDQARESGNYFQGHYIVKDKFIKKDFDRKKIKEAILLILKDYKKFGWVSNRYFIVNEILKLLEYSLFQETLDQVDTVDAYLWQLATMDGDLAEYFGKRLLLSQ